MPLWVKLIFLFWTLTTLLVYFIPKLLPDEHLYLAVYEHIGPAMPWLMLMGACVILCVLSVPCLVVWMLFVVFA